MVNDGLNTLLEMLSSAEFRKAFVVDPTSALQSRGIDGVPHNFLNVLAELSYEELRLVGNIGAELKAVVGRDGGLLF